jgi:Ca-activated chloride channel family protein
MLELESPWALLLLPALLPWLWWFARKSYADLPSARLRLALSVRLLGLVALVLALARPVLLLENRERVLFFLIDVSDSVPAAAIEEGLARAVEGSRSLEGNERAGLILFARHPRLVVPLGRAAIEDTPELRRRCLHRSEEERLRARRSLLERSELGPAEEAEHAGIGQMLAEIEAWRREIGTDETDLEAACRLARGLAPREARRRLALFTDGNQTRGDLDREAVELAAAGFSVHLWPVRDEERPEVLAEAVLVPAEAQVKAAFPLEVAIVSNLETEAVVRVYRNKYLIATRELSLKRGRNLLELSRLRLEEGFHEFEAVVQAREDSLLENNVARAALRVSGRPKVLLVERVEREARHLIEALAGEEIEVELRPEAGVPRDLNDLLNYDVLVLSDVPADRFAPGAMEAVKTYVREMGGGLVMLGGERSFGLGGYYRTPVEDALPVRMPIKKNVEKPNLALALVIDKSGSMAGDKLELAKEAAIAAAEVLKRNDRFGVWAFDSNSENLCPMTDSTQIGQITATISRLTAGGGTHIYPALNDAYQALQAESAKLKHVILLSDGHTEGSGYDLLVGHMAADRITVSTVGIGEGADRNLMEGIATWGGGEAYFTTDFGSIPQILTRETMRASKSMLVEEPFVPIVTSASPILKGIDPDSLPFLLGYVATQPKETASVVLASGHGEPVLASWSYGLGRACAFTSDAKGRWAGDWISWEAFPKFWAQLVRSVMSTGAHRELRTHSRVEVEQGVARVTLDVRDRAGAFRDDVTPELSLLREEGTASPLEVEHLGPGLFRSSFPIESYGRFHRLLVVQRRGEEVLDLRTLGVTQSYSAEFLTPYPDLELLGRLAESTGGRLEPDPSELWRFEGRPGRSPRPTRAWLLALACLLLPLDIALRRLGAS